MTKRAVRNVQGCGRSAADDLLAHRKLEGMDEGTGDHSLWSDRAVNRRRIEQAKKKRGGGDFGFVCFILWKGEVGDPAVLAKARQGKVCVCGGGHEEGGRVAE